jgi:hypothetical protein
LCTHVMSPCVSRQCPRCHIWQLAVCTRCTTRNLPSKCYFYTFYTCFTHFVQLCENTCVQLVVTHSQMLYNTSSKNMIFNIFHEKLAQKSSVFIKIMKLFITCVFNTFLKSCVHRKYHITTVNQKYWFLLFFVKS